MTAVKQFGRLLIEIGIASVRWTRRRIERRHGWGEPQVVWQRP